MSEFMRQHIAQNDKKIVKGTRRFHPLGEYPCLLSRGGPEFRDSGMQPRSHPFSDDLLYGCWEIPGEIASPEFPALLSGARALHPPQIDACVAENPACFEL